MLKILRFIWNNNGLFFISFICGTALIYSLIITFNNIKYYNQYVDGVIINISSDMTNDPDAGPGNYLYYKYKIISKESIFFSVDTKKFNLKDKVYCTVKSHDTVDILSVNNIEIGSKYGFQDVASLLTLLFLLFFLIFKFKQKWSFNSLNNIYYRSDKKH